MLVVRFKETFRERAPEWVLSAGLLCWGLLTVASDNRVNVLDYFHPLTSIMTQGHWGLAAILVSIMRLVFLVINGAWRPSAHIRALGAATSCFLWGTLFISVIGLEWVSTATAAYGMLLSLDLLSLWFAAGDAKLADLAARGKLKTV